MIYNPYPYQQYCTNRILSDPALGLFLDMGLGKTVITLTAIHALKYDRFAIRKALVIAPKKVAEATWATEAAKWAHLRQLRVTCVTGSASQRLRALGMPSDVCVISRDNTAWLVQKCKDAWPFDMVVLDESSSFKNPQSNRFRALRQVRPRIRRLVELTGTPAANGLEDLWAQLYLLDGGARLGRTLTQYRQMYFTPGRRNQTQIFSYDAKPGSLEAVQQAISDICISMKAEDYLSLPDCVYEDIPVLLDEKAASAYRDLERDLLLELEEGDITAASAGVLTGKLLQLCNGSVYDADRRPLSVHDCKLEAFLETVEQLHGQHCLVFYAFQHDRERLLAALEGTPLRVRVYTGPADEAAWNAGEIDILLAHPQSCAYGLNLQDGGHHVIWYGLTWSLEQYEQANKRLHRQGQREPVIVHHLVVQGGMDEDVMESLRAKGDTQAALLDALKARLQKVRTPA